jgi:hypothetical protein
LRDTNDTLALARDLPLAFRDVSDDLSDDSKNNAQ